MRYTNYVPWNIDQSIVPNRRYIAIFYAFVVILSVILSSCERPDPEVTVFVATNMPDTPLSTGENQTENPTRFIPPTPLIHRTRTVLPTYFGTPTPDPTRAIREGDAVYYDTHTVSIGETLSQIAQIYETSVDTLLEINNLTDGDLLAVGQQLLVPGGIITIGPSYKIIPDSELVFGPAAKEFDIRNTAAEYGGFLLSYQEEIEGQIVAGPEILQLVAQRQSVNPRLLLALLEYQAGWVTHSTSADDGYPLGYVKSGNEGLYQQLSWAANKLNHGFYGRSEGGLLSIEVGDGSRVDFARDINDGTAGIQHFFAAYPTATYEKWLSDIGPDGLFATFNHLFGNPFAYTVDPLWPANLTQPGLLLPWAGGETWYFTGGPHGGWASGSAWAALDFAPPDDQFGCYISDTWTTAMADGIVVRSDFGAVTVDLDGDSYPGTGWVITYLHLESRDRVPVGTFVQAGDRLGHPSCEGGFTNGTHVHVTRTYNGRWVSADGNIPFVMSGWVSTGIGSEYDGLLVRGDAVKEACECREEANVIINE